MANGSPFEGFGHSFQNPATNPLSYMLTVRHGSGGNTFDSDGGSSIHSDFEWHPLSKEHILWPHLPMFVLPFQVIPVHVFLIPLKCVVQETQLCCIGCMLRACSLVTDWQTSPLCHPSFCLIGTRKLLRCYHGFFSLGTLSTSVLHLHPARP